MSTLETERGSSTGRGEIWLTIYCNKKGLTETLTSNNVCTAEEFEQFIMGFNQAAPLFSFVDVGIGKEAADSKIKGTWCAHTPERSSSLSNIRMPSGIHPIPSNHPRILRRSA